jgi:hypothetical protein
MPHPERGPSPPLRVVRVPGKGRGVVATRPIPRGEVVESAPVVVVPAGQWPLVRQTALARYCFAWDDGTGSAAVALGRASLFNHSYAPNVTADKLLRSRLIRFVALRDIDAGEELTLNYNGDPGSRLPVGFEVTGG